MAVLKAIFIPDAYGLFTGARCELPSGKVVDVKARNTPFFALCRELCAVVKVAAGLAVSERDNRGLRLEKYRPFPVRGRLTDAHEGLQGSPAPETVETRLASHRDGAKAA
jgi:hypothetical protein